MNKRLLIVDDDIDFCGLLSEYLNAEGFEIAIANGGEDALEHLRSNVADVVILDVMMPGMNGFDVLRTLRGFSDVPTLMLTARGEDVDRIVGLEMGADDYVAKPCNPREIVARIRAILRRVDAPVNNEHETIVVQDIEMRTNERAVYQNGVAVELTSTEFDILEILIRAAGQVVSKRTVSESALRRKLGPHDRSIDMHVSRLRKKLGQLPSNVERIKTVRGAGYLYVNRSEDDEAPI